MARSRELWLGGGASFVAAGAALGGVAGALAAARPGYQLWLGAPMAGAYAAGALGLGCLWAAVRDWRFPLAVDRSGRGPGALPWGGPPVAGWVDRAELAVVVSALTGAGGGPVAVTTGLVGAGGFGKTMLAARVCQDRAVRRRFPGGVCWVTVGRDLDGQGLAQRISEVVWNLGGEGATFASVEEAGRALAGALAARRPMLLVADDVWTSGQLAPFVTAGQAGQLLVTTRRPVVLAGAGARQVEVDAVPWEVARRILARDLPPMVGWAEEDLLGLAGGWPLLLSLINARLAKDLGRGGDIDAPASGAAARLRRDGPAALDIKDPESRQLAVAATIGYSLDTLDAADQDRFCQLGIFAEDAEIPLPLITALWQATATMSETDVVALCERLDGLSLVSLAWAGDRRVMVVHDVIRDFARSKLGPERVAELNGVLLAVVAADRTGATPPGAHGGGSGVPWWELGAGGGYLREHLIWHLIQAGRGAEAEPLACDLRWAGARLAESGPAAVAADLALAGTPRAARMAAAVIREAHLLAPAEPANAVVDTLHSRLAADPDWGPQVTALKDTYRRPRLVNRWPLPDLPNPAQRAVLEGHQDWVNGVCVVTVADRQLLASGGSDGTVRLWDPATGAQQAILEGHQDRVRGVCAVTVAGRKWLASAAEDGTVRIWDPATRTQQGILQGHQGPVFGVCAVTVAGRQLLASAGDRTVRIWRLVIGAQQAILGGHQGRVRGVCAVTVAGRQLLASAAEDGTVRIWDPATRTQQGILQGHQGPVFGVCAVTVAGRQLLASAAGDDTVRIWDPATRTQQGILQGHQDWVFGVCVVTVAGRKWLASGGSDGSVRIWDPATGAQQAILKGHQGPVNGVCAVTVAGRQLLASAAGDDTVRIWDPAAGTQQAILQGHQGTVNGVCPVTVADRQLLASAGSERTVRIWDPATGTQQAILQGHQGTVRGVCAVTVAGRQLLASAADDDTVRIWDPATGTKEAVLQGHQRRVRGVCAVTVAGRQLLASAADDRTVRIWDPATRTQQAVLEGHQGPVNGVCPVTVAGRQLLASVGSDRTVRLWDPATSRGLALVRVERPLFACARIDCRGLAAGGDGGVYGFDILFGANPGQ
jgi:WD40 repeat protein